MREEIEKGLPEAANSGNSTSSNGLSSRAGKILADANTQNIERKQS